MLPKIPSGIVFPHQIQKKIIGLIFSIVLGIKIEAFDWLLIIPNVWQLKLWAGFTGSIEKKILAANPPCTHEAKKIP